MANQRSRWGGRSLRPVALGIVGALVGVLAYVAVVSPSSSNNTPTKRSSAPTTSTTAAPVFAAKAYKAIQPSFVYVQAQKDASAADGGAIGSGVVVNATGQILTANHVIANAADIQVTFADGTQANATVASSQPDKDIAVLQPDRLPKVVVPAVLAGGVQVGDDVYALGNPLALAGSFSAGVVSALGRTIPQEDGDGELHDLIQFDAAVNSGSSGGPLVNRAGQVVGIVTALANPTNQSFFIGIGFAIPIATAGGAAGAPPR
ncbi:MAG: peptidase and chymotrypsin/Hap [Actinomycetia bacterium]|nr:peptidase and chymotrypsin/Hap [Actinomycetes bacterium]